MVFHIGHFTVFALLEPLLQTRGFGFQKFGFGYTTRKESQILGGTFDDGGIVEWRQHFS